MIDMLQENFWVFVEKRKICTSLCLVLVVLVHGSGGSLILDPPCVSVGSDNLQPADQADPKIWIRTPCRLDPQV